MTRITRHDRNAETAGEIVSQLYRRPASPKPNARTGLERVQASIAHAHVTKLTTGKTNLALLTASAGSSFRRRGD